VQCNKRTTAELRARDARRAQGTRIQKEQGKSKNKNIEKKILKTKKKSE
jgi:hypothetical protein